ncbi:MAG: lipopolysaccharide heptosyltransferase I [Victivallales bacterium]|nr:lipopolysaccharide heptosyltransferase I [Victivallales bacterium]
MQKYCITPVDELENSKKAGTIRSVLVVKMSSLGDVIHTFPVIALLHKSLPGVKIDWVVNKNLAVMLEWMKPYLNEVITFNRSKFKGLNIVKETFRIAKILRRKKYDCVIDLQGLMKSSLITFLSKSEEKVGFSRPREKIARYAYNRKIEIPQGIKHAIEKNIYLVSDYLELNAKVPDFKIPASEKYFSVIDQLLNGVGIDINKNKYIVISPGARWESKRWPADFFASTADRVAVLRNDLKLVIIGSREEKELAEEIIHLCVTAEPVSLAGKTDMIELVEVLRNAELLLANDSGPMHIAAALRTKVFALFGPTDPELTGPYWPGNRVFQNSKGCIKCFKRKCVRGDNMCRKTVGAFDIAEEIVNSIKS